MTQPADRSSTPAPKTPTALARALGRLPTGLYIVTTFQPGQPTGPAAGLGFVGSFVMQVGLEPPQVCVAVGKARGPLAAIRDSGRFAINILDAASQPLMKPFFRKPTGGESPFDGLELEPLEGPPRLKAALAWLDCLVTGEHATDDHVVFFGRVVAGALQREGEPSIHLRKDGLGY